jgi:ferritin
VALLLKEDPQQWDKMALYTKMREKVVGLKVINDCAERAIALMSQFNNCLAKDEGRKRNILQVVEHNRKRVKSCSKDSLKHYDIVN